MLLHVVIPFYNEPATLEECVRRVRAALLPAGWSKRIVIVDDASASAGRSAAAAIDRSSPDVVLHRHGRNRGKGAAVRTGFAAVLESAADDDLVIIQDADLEYDPSDFARLMGPVIEGRADATIGSRWGVHRASAGFKRRVHELGNRVLTAMSNVMTGYDLADMECCYKLMPVALLRRVAPRLTEDRFGIEPQLVAALASLGARVEQVPVSYDPRGLAAGKKIRWTDGVRAVYVIARERVRPRGSGSAA